MCIVLAAVALLIAFRALAAAGNRYGLSSKLGCIHAADDVEVTGVVKADWRPLFPGAPCDGTLTIKACATHSIHSRHRAMAAPADGLQDMFRWAGSTGVG